MTDSAFITMLIVLGVVWGGFVLLLVIALRKEAVKKRGSDAPASPDEPARGNVTPQLGENDDPAHPSVDH